MSEQYFISNALYGVKRYVQEVLYPQHRCIFLKLGFFFIIRYVWNKRTNKMYN